MRIRTLLALCLTLLGLSACASRGDDFTLLSTKNVELSRVDLQNMQFNRNIEEGDGQFILFFFPLGSAPSMEEAVDQCLEEGGGDFMTSAVVYHNAWHVLLFGYREIIVKGDVGNSITGRAIANVPE